MKYNCGHLGCDICGARQCADVELKKYSLIGTEYIACDSCVKRAIRLAVHVSEEFSTIIDFDKPCGKRLEVRT